MLSRYGLNALNFLVAAIQSGFGPFITVWLSQNGWNLGTIGVALSVGTFAQLIAQLPAGAVVDHIHRKRNVTAGALIMLGVSALLLGLPPTRTAVWSAEILHSLASAIMTPAIAALTLSLCGHDSFSGRLGINASYAAVGGAASAVLLGFAESLFSVRAVFLVTAAMAAPAMAALLAIRSRDHVDPEDDHRALLHPREREHPPWCIYRDPTLHTFAIAAVLFQLANAALLPAMLSILTRQGDVPVYLVPATIVVPQAVTALLSPWAGKLAQRFGRRPVLLMGFAAVPLRAVLFAFQPDASWLIVFQVLDGVSATVFGLMLPLIASDVTRDNGYLNMAIGSLGLAAGLGATFSTVLAGFVADTFGDPTAFIGLALAGAASVGLLAAAMPETRMTRVVERTTPAAAQ